MSESSTHLLAPWGDVTGRETSGLMNLQGGGGIYVRDRDGNEMIDGPGGMWCVNVGHGRSEIVEAAAQQMRALAYASPWYMATNPSDLLAERLADLAPGDLNTVFFTTGGSTAVDSALRFAFFYNNCLGRPDKKLILSRQGAYHGSTFLTASCSGKMLEKEQMDMAEGMVSFLSCPKTSDRAPHESEAEFCDRLLAEMEARIQALGAEKIAAFIAEPIMASGGVIVPPEGYFKRCNELCRAHDILFIADEVVTAFGRLGHMFACEAVFGVSPDMITTAKGLTSGYVPLGALLISDRLLDDIRAASNEPRSFFNGFTYSGHPVAAAAALANLDIFEREHLLEHVREVAPHFERALAALRKHTVVRDVRVAGLMAGIECVLDPENPDEERDCAFTAAVDTHAQAMGLLLRPVYRSCVISPPLTISKDQIDTLAGILDAAIAQAMADL